MDTIQDAQKVLRDAEMMLRRLMEQSLKQQRYASIAEIACMAEGVARLLNKQSSPITPDAASNAKSVSHTPPRARERSHKKKTNYPRFERDGDRLVKVGWSKKNKEAYEHRAPREAVVAVARHLSSQVRVGEVFAIEDLMPVPNVSSGDEVPGYQVYLTLAWLRSLNAIEKKGRDGYVLRSDLLTDGELDKLWEELAVRSA